MSSTLLRGNLVFLSRHCSGKGPHLAVRGKSPAFSQVAAGSLAFLSICDGDLMDLIVFPRRSQVSFRVARGTSGFLSSSRRGIGPCLEFCWSTQCSVLGDRDLGLPLKVQQGSQASCGVGAWNSAFLSSCQRGGRPPVEFRRGIRVFSRGSAGESDLPSYCEEIPGVPLEPMQGYQDLSRVEWELGFRFPCSRIGGVPLEIQ